MDETRIIIKSEQHSSRADFDQERALLRDGVDYLIIEKSKEKAQYRPSQYWFALLMWLMTQFFFRIFYSNNKVLEDIALVQGADVLPTRESNASVLENAGIVQQLIAVTFMIICLILSAYFGVVGFDWATNNWNYMISVLLIPLAVLLPVYIIRDSDSDNKAGNRDEIIANKITNSAKQGGIVVAILGKHHADDVHKHISEEFDTVFKPPKYDVLSFSNLKQNLHSIFVFVSILLVIHQVFITAILSIFRIV